MADKRDLDAVMAEAEAACRQRGGRLTRGRRGLLAALLSVGRPLTAYELLDLMRPGEPSATPASVYRGLDFLLRHGLVHRLETSRAYMACTHPEHAHGGHFMICRQCGNVVEANDAQVSEATAQLSQAFGFAVEQQTVELVGVCGECRG